jgi:predicted small metal-binding protein
VKLIRCECGYVARGDSDEQVVGMIRGHMTTDHPALLKSVSDQDLRSWIQAELPRFADGRPNDSLGAMM